MTNELRISIGAGMALVLAMLLTIGSGCHKIPNGGIPIYIKIDSPTIIDDGLVGNINWKIPDVYVAVNNTDLGGYQMPATVPVLSEGDARMIVSGGVYKNGIVSQRADYPFWRPDTFTVANPQAGQVYRHHPVYHYYSDVQHGLLDDFNAGTQFDSAMTVVPDIDADSLSGRVWQCGALVLGANDSIKGTIQRIGSTIVTNGREAYVEFNFKQSGTSQAVSFDVGLQSVSSTGYTTNNTILTIFPTNYWKKTYLDFSNFVGSNTGSTFYVYFVGYNTSGAPVNFYFDDVKLLYLQ